MSGVMFSAEDWRRVLHRLAEELRKSGRDVRVIVIGGVAMALAHQSRRTTDDMDVLLPDEDAQRVVRAADQIAPEFGLEQGWLNERAKEAGLVPTWDEGGCEPVFTEDGLVVLAARPLHLLAMKLWAGTRSETDLQDVSVLISKLRADFSDPESLWSVIGSMLPVDKRQDAHHNLVDIWEMTP
jgi:hypothetical protein